MASIHVSRVSSILSLDSKYTTFPPVDDQHNVFFERANKQILSCRNEENSTSITVKCLDNREKALFRVPLSAEAEILSIKLSPNNRIIAVQKVISSVEFTFESKDGEMVTITQTTKSKSACIQGFFWITNEDLAYVTSSGIEIYRVSADKKKVRLSSEISILVNWYLWHNTTSMVVLASGQHASIIQCYKFMNKYSLVKQKRLQLDDLVKENKSKGRSETINKADCNVYYIYGLVYFGVLTLVETKNKRCHSDLILFEISQNPNPKKFILMTEYSGGLCVSVVDNLIVLHHKHSKTSVIFDVKQENMPSRDDPNTIYLRPLLSPSPVNVDDGPSNDYIPRDICIYDHDWLCFQPNVLINGRLGLALHLKCSLTPATKLFTDKVKLISFLHHRNGGRMNLLNVCRHSLIPGPHQATVYQFRSIFKLIVSSHKPHEYEGHSLLLSDTVSMAQRSCMINTTAVTQEEVYSEIFTVFNERKDLSCRYKLSVLVEYLQALSNEDIPPEHFICELLVNMLVTEKRFYQLHQFIQYHVVPDSKPIACLLLSLESVYPPAFQLGLDMFMRITTAYEEIVEVLLSKKYIIPALKYIRSERKLESLSAKKYLEMAKDMKPKSIFYAVFKLFEARNRLNTGCPDFPAEEDCDAMVKYFVVNFGEDYLAQDHPFVPFNKQLLNSLPARLS